MVDYRDEPVLIKDVNYSQHSNQDLGQGIWWWVGLVTCITTKKFNYHVSDNNNTESSVVLVQSRNTVGEPELIIL